MSGGRVAENILLCVSVCVYLCVPWLDFCPSNSYSAEGAGSSCVDVQESAFHLHTINNIFFFQRVSHMYSRIEM